MIVVRLIPFFATLVVAVVVILLSDSHSWSSATTTWALTAVFGGSTVIDFALSRWWERVSRRRHRHMAHNAK